MYGMVNRAIRECITDHHGEDVWAKALKGSKASDDDFVRMQHYSDEVTVSLVVATAEHTGKSVDEILEEVGVFWIDFALKSDYGPLLRQSGKTLPEVLASLDALHSRLEQAFPDLTPPSFWCSDADESQTQALAEGQEAPVLHYLSERDGLSAFVKGLVRGLGKMLSTDCSIQQTASKADGAEHDEFFIEYSSNPA